MSYLDYFRTFYTPMAAEFVQADDDGFVTHHCLRTLHRVWHEEMDFMGAAAIAGGYSTRSPRARRVLVRRRRGKC
jgi:hypothetical protein